MSFESNANGGRWPYNGRGPQNVSARRYKRLSSDNTFIMCVLYLFAFAMVSTVYVLYTSQMWSYLGLTLSINPTKVFVSVAVLLTFVAFIPKQWSLRAFFLNIVVTTSVIPSLVLYSFSDKPTVSAIIIWSSVAIVYLVSAVRFPRMKILSISPRIIMWILLILSAFFIGAIVLLGGFRYFNLDFSRVYEFRDQAADSLPPGFDYLSTTFSNAIVPLGIAFSLHYKNNINVLLFVLMSILMFGLTSHKVMFFTPFVVTGAYFLIAYSPKYRNILIGFCTITLIIAASVILIPYFSANSFWGWLENLFIRRTLMVPAMLDYSYISFFSDNDQYYWSTSKISLGLLSPPHNGVSPPEMIGLAHFGTTAAWADTGFIGSGFAQAGVLGSIIYAVAVGLMISIFQSFSRDLGVPMIASATLGLFATMIHSSDFVSLFLTHGLMLTLIILMSLHVGEAGPRVVRRKASARLHAGRSGVNWNLADAVSKRGD